MSFIKVQKLVRDENGNIVSGSAAVVDTIYGSFGSYHAKHIVRERLGKVILLSGDKKSGVFLSPIRGLVEYDAVADTFKPIEKNDGRLEINNLFPEPEVHTVFGDVYLLLKFLEKSSYLALLRSVFQKNEQYERVIVHILHGILKDGSRITADNFISKSFASYLLPDVAVSTLKSDTGFFAMLGDDKTRMSFFKAFVSMMRSKDPSFGKGCYVDSTPLPNDIENNPFNALSCHGVGSSDIMTRLILVLDENTGLPVWYDIIPGNVLDISTIMTVVNDVASSLAIEIDSLTLDAGYVSKEVVDAFHIGTHKKIIARMPARKGYPFKELYWDMKDLFSKGKYCFARKSHAYFGKRTEIDIFSHKEYAYVYVDKNNALSRYSTYLVEHSTEYEVMKDKDKDWLAVKYGYFVLISNIETSPEKLLELYFERTDIESVFKSSKEYLDILPLSKWTDTTVRGKILHDIINTIIRLEFLKETIESGISLSEIFGKCQSLMCFRNKAMVTIEAPSKPVKKYFSLINEEIPSHVDLAKFKAKVLLL